MAFALDYIDVATRIVEFRTQHPDGSLQQVEFRLEEFAGKSWVIYTAAAYRSPEDARHGIGTAWEPVPGKTNFTRALYTNTSSPHSTWWSVPSVRFVDKWTIRVATSM